MENKFEKKANRKNEIISLFLIAIAIFFAIVLWVPAAKTGFLGNLLQTIIQGLFGTLGTVLPVFLLIIAIDRLLSKAARISTTRKNCILLLFLACVVLISVFQLDPSRVYNVTSNGEKPSVFKAISMFWESGLKPEIIFESSVWSGGLIGGILGLSLIVVAGKVGAIIIVAAMILALAIVIFNLSYTQYLEKSAEMIQNTKEKLEEKRRLKNEAKEEQRLAEEEAAKLESEALAEAKEHEAELYGLVMDDESEAESEIELYKEGYDFDLSKNKNLEDPHNVSSEWLKQEYAKEKNIEYEEPFQPNYDMPEGSWITDADSESPYDFQPEFPNFSNEEIKQTTNETSQSIDQVETTSDEVSSESDIVKDQTETKASQSKAENNIDQPEKVASKSDSEQEHLIKEADIEILEDQGRSHWEDRSDSSTTPEYKLDSGKKKQISFTDVYIPPDISLLNKEQVIKQDDETINHIQDLGVRLEQTLNDFGVDAKVVNYTTGPTITRFELAPGPGVKVSKITNLADDIALSLAAIGVRIEAPIPGKSAIGIEIPNKETQPVLLSGIIDSEAFRKSDSLLTAGLGRDIQGNEILCDLAKMPHVLIAGATGSGKSVCINSIIISLIYRSSPEDLKMIMVDPKVVELNVYNGIPHLLLPVVTDPKKAYGALNWAITEMEDRYNKFADNSVRDFSAYNLLIESKQIEGEKLPAIVIIIDELSDLMATTPKEVEDAIARLTAMARAAGIHLIIATQRPSVDVITGVIKANIPSRIAFTVASQVDSRTILDMGGAEKLLGKGDMLYYPQSASKPIRGQGAFVTDGEVERVVRYLKEYYEEDYDESVQEAIEQVSSQSTSGLGSAPEQEEEDELLEDALHLVLESDYASISLLQRRLSIGYPRAARIIDRLHDLGYVGPPEGSKPRTVLITLDEYLEQLEEQE